MRVAIREQLAALVLLAVLVALAIVSIPTWEYVYHFVVNVEKSGLSLTASLKAAQIASQIELIQTTCFTITTRLLVQDALRQYYLSNATQTSWTQATADLNSGLNSGGLANLLQARLFSRNDTGKSDQGLLSVTGSDIAPILLPYKGPDGSPVYLSNDTDLGYPPSLYPNLTYYPSQDPDPYNPGQNAVVARPFPGVRIDGSSGGLILGPLVINETYALVSLTLPIRQIGDSQNVLGYMTVVAEATSVISILASPEGLGNTGTVLLIGPATGWNRFSKYNLPANATNDAASNFSSVDVQFMFPPRVVEGHSDRHTRHNYASGDYDESFKVTDYNAAYKSWTRHNPVTNNASSMLSTTNEQGVPVAVGYAIPQSSLMNWTLIVEQAREEAYIPTHTLQDILLGTVFGTAGLVILLIFPCAHLGVKPIRKLKAATERSISPPGYAEAYMDDADYEDDEHHSSGVIESDPRRRVFKIPGKVKDRKHYVTDELTELTTTFNEMSDELLRQYESLEDKVQQRTQELEISKKAAEAANESKTLFIANISHELKTPLNGILGMAAVCMEEDDINKIKQSLKLLYKSGDLLFHLLEDLLNFSKNQIGQQLSLEEKEFRLGDIRAQVRTIFDKQVREGKIKFSVDFMSTDVDPSQSTETAELDPKLPALGPPGVGRLKDMCLWGDQHRILQVLINLVSNSLKFTPAEDESRSSSFSKTNSNRRGRTRHSVGSGSNHSTPSRDASTPQPQFPGGTALSINPMNPKNTPVVQVHERSQTPPPSNARPYMFEFQVQDSGPGIPEHMQQRVFEPFVQGDLGLSRKYGGTGLGLSICQQLANLMGGSISLQSTQGVGTTFTMHIPLKYTKDRASSTASSSMKSRPQSVNSAAEGEGRRSSLTQATAEAKVSVLDQQPRLVGLSQPFFAANPAQGAKSSPEHKIKAAERARAHKGEGKLRVLVAEDNPTNIEVVSRMLKLEDVYDVTIAKDGQEAYDLVKADMESNLHFDLIFMDIQMPNVDGLQSTRLIREMGYSAPIVALTAFADESNVKNCMESGMDEFLSKPIRRPALKQVLKKFATIPEEPETASLKGRKSTSAEKGSSSVVQTQPASNPMSSIAPDAKAASPVSTSPVNGTLHPSSPTTK
ncbi:osmosensing histidine protein kinase SLN1 [Xylariaceae sp. FL0804]|nr:osmosensing histidine protein kinase SLN1 [Xylariaceae sp. FL0804]